MKTFSASRGFSLFELLLVIAMIAIVAGVSMPYGLSYFRTQTLNSIESQMADVLDKARNQSVVQKDDAQYGVYMQASSSLKYYLFKGSSYTAQPTDEPYDVPPDTTIVFPGSLQTILFSKHTGMPSATGTITISRDSMSRTIIIDSFGNLIKS